MTEKQLNLLMKWVESLIDARLDRSQGRDSLIESIRESEARTELVSSVRKSNDQ